MRDEATLRVLIRLAREALAGPLGTIERRETAEQLAEHERELKALTVKS